MNPLQNSLITQALAPQAVAATTETTGTVIDLQSSTLAALGGFSDIVFILTSASGTDTSGTFVVKESSDNSTYTAITNATVTYNQTAAVGTYRSRCRPAARGSATCAAATPPARRPAA